METSKLSPCQEEARVAFNNFLKSDEQFFILTGSPGCGKSYLTQLLLSDVQRTYAEENVHATATTNKAAKVVADFVDTDALTIHSLLGLRVRNNPKTGRQDLIRSPQARVVSHSFILIDEISMIDNALLAALDEGTHKCRFLLVGDKDQLAPVGQHKPPVFLKGYQQFELKTIMRQASGNGGAINVLAEALKETIQTGVFNPQKIDGKEVIHLSGEEFQMKVDEMFTEDIPVDKYKIICWKNDTVKAYNNYIRQRHIQDEHFIIGETVVTNQPIIQQSSTVYSTDEYAEIVDLRPDTVKGIEGYWYQLDRGCVVFQATDPEKVKSYLKQLAADAKAGGYWHEYFQAKEFFGDLRAIHACTAYKSQGSSYHSVFIDLDDIGECRQWEQVARMLYVAITRAKHKVYLYGSLPLKYTDFSHKVK